MTNLDLPTNRNKGTFDQIIIIIINNKNILCKLNENLLGD